MKKHLSHLTGIAGITVNLSQHSATVRWDPDNIKFSDILLELHYIGYQGHPWRAERQEALMQQEHRVFIRRLSVAGIAAMQVMMYAIALYAGAMQDMEAEYRDFYPLDQCLCDNTRSFSTPPGRSLLQPGAI